MFLPLGRASLLDGALGSSASESDQARLSDSSACEFPHDVGPALKKFSFLKNNRIKFFVMKSRLISKVESVNEDKIKTYSFSTSLHESVSVWVSLRFAFSAAFLAWVACAIWRRGIWGVSSHTSSQDDLIEAPKIKSWVFITEILFGNFLVESPYAA